MGLSSCLELHARYFLIRAHNLVPHLHHQLKRDVRFLDCNHHVVDVAAIALQQVRDLLFRASVKFFHLVDGSSSSTEPKLPSASLAPEAGVDFS